MKNLYCWLCGERITCDEKYTFDEEGDPMCERCSKKCQEDDK